MIEETAAETEEFTDELSDDTLDREQDGGGRFFSAICGGFCSGRPTDR
jgi:hypothetical protein